MKRICLVAVLLVLCSFGTQAQAQGNTTPGQGWPASISGDSGFADLGRAIKNEPGFPANGTDIDKAKYVFSRMEAVAQKYGLKSGSGGLGSILIGLYRLSNDPEGAECLKGKLGWGNCGEWSYAMSEIFGGSGVNNRVAYGDKSGGTGSSYGFAGTDTMVIVEERSPDGKVSRRVFDVFRAAYHSGKDQPTPETLQKWGDMPLTNYDLWKNETRKSWQNSVLPFKPFIKDAVTKSELVLPFPPRIDPSTTTRPFSLVSGVYQVETNNRGTVHHSTWTLKVSGNNISGSSEWQCCPGKRMDSLEGQIDGEGVTIVRDCRGQGITVECRQTYSGKMGNGVIRGTFSGVFGSRSDSSPQNVWILYLK